MALPSSCWLTMVVTHRQSYWRCWGDGGVENKIEVVRAGVITLMRLWGTITCPGVQCDEASVLGFWGRGCGECGFEVRPLCIVTMVVTHRQSFWQCWGYRIRGGVFIECVINECVGVRLWGMITYTMQVIIALL